MLRNIGFGHGDILSIAGRRRLSTCSLALSLVAAQACSRPQPSLTTIRNIIQGASRAHCTWKQMLGSLLCLRRHLCRRRVRDRRRRTGRGSSRVRRQSRLRRHLRHLDRRGGLPGANHGHRWLRVARRWLRHRVGARRRHWHAKTRLHRLDLRYCVAAVVRCARRSDYRSANRQHSIFAPAARLAEVADGQADEGAANAEADNQANDGTDLGLQRSAQSVRGVVFGRQ